MKKVLVAALLIASTHALAAKKGSPEKDPCTLAVARFTSAIAFANQTAFRAEPNGAEEVRTYFISSPKWANSYSLVLSNDSASQCSLVELKTLVKARD